MYSCWDNLQSNKENKKKKFAEQKKLLFLKAPPKLFSVICFLRM